MLKLIFWSLLCINAAVFAYGQGYLGNFKGNEREPARMKNQLNADKLKLAPPPAGAGKAAGAGGETADKVADAPANAADSTPAPAATAAPQAESPAASPAESLATAPAADLVACTLVGNFAAPEARRFEALVAPLAFGKRQTRESLTVPEVTSHIVFIPPQASKEAADRKAAELKELGVSSFFIMNDSSPMKWGISLGVFKSETAAQTLLAALTKQGVVSAKVAPRTSQSPRSAYRFRDIEREAKAKLDAIAARFPQQETRSCK